ncbi:MAG: hypothetical protein OIN88_00365 [Candidatus Methanoperedens sp.]|nr:hypothetical protein [Candidatus Methanoperedens sp.]
MRYGRILLSGRGIYRRAYLQDRLILAHSLHFSVCGRTVMLLDHRNRISGQPGDLLWSPASSLAELDACCSKCMERSS